MNGIHTAVTIGKFECLHRGHQRLVANILGQQENGLKGTVLAIETKGPRMLTESEKKGFLSRAGVQECRPIPMDEKLRTMEPEDFVRHVLVDELHAGYVTAGTDFCFGHDRRGDGELLEKLGRQYGFSVELVEKEKEDGRVISSSWIREELEKGHIFEVNRLLGYRYYIAAPVVRGNRIGHKMNLPTINLLPSQDKLLPPNGVYISTTLVEGRFYGGITDIGCKPTIPEQEKQLGVETHLFDFDGDIYGKRVCVTLWEYLRPEKKFADIACLKQQISEDILRGKQYFSQSS